MQSRVMAYAKSSSVRFHDDVEVAKSTAYKSNNPVKHKYSIDGESISMSASEVFSEKPRRSFKAKVLSRVFSEDYESTKVEIFDPSGQTTRRWNKIFLGACLTSLFVDPLFFYLPSSQGDKCIYVGISLLVILTIIRSLADMFYTIHIFIRFRTAFIAPSSRVFGRGELVIDSLKIASRYLSKGFCLDLVAALPIPQFVIWIVIPGIHGSMITKAKDTFRFSIIFQYLLRLFLIFPLSSQIVETTGFMTETAWVGAAYNLILYMLASHVIGASWYLLSLERQEACWREACHMQSPSCQFIYFDCRSNSSSRNRWFQHSNLKNLCSPSSNFYQFGIYSNAVNNKITSSPFLQRYFYSFFWGLKTLSCLGQNLVTSTNIGENIFAIVVAILGLVLFGLLIGNMQSYLQSTMARLEEWRIKRTDTEEWMHHRQLPSNLKQRVRRHDQHLWMATQGVQEESLLRELPMDLRRDIKRHLCLDLVRRVPLFDEMDDRMLDAICERLRPALYTEGTHLVRELDPVEEMLLIIRGRLDSYTTNGGRTGFFNSCSIGPGDFCGEELLPWALDPSEGVLPSSTRSARAVTEVEAFALAAGDLMVVAARFRRLHSRSVRQRFRFYSHQWRAWAARFVQAAWRRHRAVAMDGGGDRSSLKPTEPDFSVEEVAMEN